MEDPAAKFATPRLASGALFVKDDQILLVRKTYGGHKWDIPGGYVDRGESPTTACEREIKEEIGLRRTAQRLLVHDWAPSDKEGDKILYVFDCGTLGDDEFNIRVDGVEVDKTEWVAVNSLTDYVTPRLTRRLTAAFNALKSERMLYLEHGRKFGSTEPE